MLKITLILILFLSNLQFALSKQYSSIIPNKNKATFIKVDCDSTGLDIYIDDILVGKSPIDSPIPIEHGFHIVSYLNPQFLKLLEQNYSATELESLLSRSLKKVYVSKGETLTVNLWWKPYEKHLIARKRFVWIKSIFGLVFITTLFYLNL
tara:strand:- start:570 stop:1022 length:453 start_codon:yes stop_codon:yes gene_type:complete